MVYLINSPNIDFIRIPVWYLKDKKLLLPDKTHLINETSDSFLILDSFNVSVWIPKEIVVVEPEFE